VISSGKPKLQPRKSGETEESIRNMERQDIAAAGKMDAGASSHRQQPSQMEADFRKLAAAGLLSLSLQLWTDLF
jgi:hypothetical protein